MKKAIIGGTGVYNIGEATVREVTTEYGKVVVDVLNINGEEIAFLARHGKGHSVPPHLINYRANMKALKELGVEFVYATCAVGSMNEQFAPGDAVVLKDFIDFTKSRPLTFFEGGEGRVAHVAMDEPYCPNLRKKFVEHATKMGLDVKGEAVYACMEGPRFETASEIRMLQKLGADIVGMTNVPEVVLAKELGMCYQAVGIITNWCTGFKGLLTDHDIQGIMAERRELVTKAFISVFTEEQLSQDVCSCKDCLVIM